MAEKAPECVAGHIDTDDVVQNMSTGTGMGYHAQHDPNIGIAPIGCSQSMTAFAPLEAYAPSKSQNR